MLDPSVDDQKTPLNHVTVQNQPTSSMMLRAILYHLGVWRQIFREDATRLLTVSFFANVCLH